MVAAVLEEIPKGAEEVEEYVAALFQSSGHFVEKNIREDMMELDVAATSYVDGLPTLTMAEAKSGDWRTRDIFSLLGQMTFLRSKRGVFFVTNDRGKSAEDYNKRMNPFGVHFLPLGDPTDLPQRFAGAGFAEPRTQTLFGVLRYASWAERRLVRELYRSAKEDKLQGSREAIKYYALVTGGVFFNEDVRSSLHALFDAFKAHPRLSMALACEIGGRGFDAKTTDTSPVWKEALYDCKHWPVHCAWYVEHRAKLAILKKAVDYLCLERAAVLPKKRVLGLDLSAMLVAAFPPNFKEGLAWLRAQPNFERFPFFWQMFLWGLGGFYLTHRQEEEFAYMADLAGIELNQVPVALEVFDRMFPLAGGESWLKRPGNVDICLCMLVPGALRGVGAFHRLERDRLKTYEELGCRNYTLADLSTWHNCAVHLLTGKAPVSPDG